jgi:hypothetical protein
MKQKRFALLFTCSLFVAPHLASANDQSNGCGLGWSVVKKNSLISSTTRSLTNLTLPNAFSMTSGTSGCAHHSIVKRDREPTYFAEATYPLLLADIARGKGEYLDSFAATFGCEKEAQGTFDRALRAEFSNLNSSSSPSEFVNRVNQVLQNRQSLSMACTTRGV